jgi:hypothetical protein
MAERKPSKKTRKPANRKRETSGGVEGFTLEERTAMRDRARELKSAARGAKADEAAAFL